MIILGITLRRATGGTFRGKDLLGRPTGAEGSFLPRLFFRQSRPPEAPAHHFGERGFARTQSRELVQDGNGAECALAAWRTRGRWRRGGDPDPLVCGRHPITVQMVASPDVAGFPLDGRGHVDLRLWLVGW